jgi:hypothetical protein
MEEPEDDKRPFSYNINKRPNKRSHTRGRSIHPNEHTGISKQVIPANQLKNPTWNHELRQWTEGTKKPPVYEEESKHTQLGATSEIRGRTGDDSLFSRLFSSSKIRPWRKYTIGRGVHSRQHSRQPSRLPLGSGQGGRRRTHKRKNKHIRRVRA